MEGVISGNLDIFPQLGFPYVGYVGLDSAYVTTCEEILKEHSQIAAAEGDGVEDEEGLEDEVDQPSGDLTPSEVSQTHDDIGCLGGGITLGEAFEEASQAGGCALGGGCDPRGCPLRGGFESRHKGTTQTDEGGLRDEGEALVGWMIHSTVINTWIG